MNNNEISLSNSKESKVVLATKSEIKAKRKELLEQEEKAKIDKQRLFIKLTKILGKNCFKEKQAIALVNYLCYRKLQHNEIIYIIKSSLKLKKNEAKIISLIKPIFKKNSKELTKTNELRKLFSKDTGNDIINIVKEIKNIDDGKYIKKFIDGKIFKILENDQQPNTKILVDSIEQYTKLYVDHSTLKYYAKIKNSKGKEQIKNISLKEITDYCNKAFGSNKISKNICSSVLKFITRSIEKDYHLLEFSNGSLKLNKNDYEFLENEFFTDRIPKIVFPFEWNPLFEDGEENKIENIIKDILKCDDSGFEENINNFYKCVGNACMAINAPQIFTIFLGPPGTGKSTILTILKRIFNYSEVPIPKIIKNDRFELYPSVDKDINIDDDLQTDTWKNIGKLNTFVSGNGIQVEVKGENDRVLLNQYNTPKLFGSTNILPKVEGMGHKRRLILIKAENKISEDKKDDTLQYNISNGEYDKGLAKLIYKSINLFYDNRNNLFSKESKKAMLKEWDFRSNPLTWFIDDNFKVPNSDELFSGKCRDIPVADVNFIVKMFLVDAFDKGKIDSVHANPSSHKIKKVMLSKGFTQGTMAIINDEGNKSSIAVYKDVLERDSIEQKDNDEVKYDEDILI